MNWSRIQLCAIALLLTALAGCASAPSRPARISSLPTGGTTHTVKSGETMWRISQAYGIDVRALAQANSMSTSSTISRGQILLIPGSDKVDVQEKQVVVPPTTVSRTSLNQLTGSKTFLWPAKGIVIASFGEKTTKVKNKGIDIMADEGSSVKASRGGRVVYCDPNLKGFGKTVILDHGDNFQTVYAYNSDILVKVGDRVNQNDVIAKIGKTGRAKKPSLHFEIRKDSRPQNPEYYLR